MFPLPRFFIFPVGRSDLKSGELSCHFVGKFLIRQHQIGYTGPCTVEMIPFCRLPDLVLPDQALADKVADQLLSL